MIPFPYFKILRKARDTAFTHRCLWVFGLFLGGMVSFYFTFLNYFFSPPPSPEELKQAQEQWNRYLESVNHNPKLFVLTSVVVLAVVFLLIILAGIARGSVIWATGRDESSAQKLNFRTSFRAGLKFLGRLILLQLLITLFFVILFLVFSSPVFYLFAIGAPGRAAALAILALIIFVPAAVVFSFLHLFGPVFLVLYERKVGESITLAFNLFKAKLKESLVLAVLVLGISALFVFALIFSIIIISLFFSFLEIPLWVFGIISFCYTIVAGAVFKVFQNAVWVLAVKEMVKTGKIQENKPVLAAESA